MPVSFEPNRGQTATGIDFLGRVSGRTLSLQAARAELISQDSRIATVLVGGHPSHGQGEVPLAGVVHYLKGSDPAKWLTDIPTFARVRYKGVYRGIDLVYYGNDGRLEYDFQVAPGADPRQIRLRYEGVRRVALDGSGDLLIRSAGDTIRQHRPSVYQEIRGVRRQIAARYVLRGDTVSFELAAYDHARALVIDPALTWATYFGGTGSDSAYAVTSDSTGNVYVTGGLQSTRGDLDCFVAKLNPAGTQAIFTALVGGSGNDEGHGIAVDSAGNVYLAGATDSDDFPVVNASQNLAGASGTLDGFIAKLDPTGKSYVYSNYIGGSSDDFAFALALDSNNNLYIAGATVSIDFPVTRGGAQRTAGGGIDGFVSLFDASGKLIYSTYLGGSADDYAYGIGVDSAGNMYVTGSTTSTDFPGVSGALQPAFQSTKAGGIDAYVAKLNSGGLLAWSTYLGGAGDDQGLAIAVDGAGSAYITGGTASSDFPTASPYQGAFAGGPRDMFAAKFSPDGTKLVYSTYLGGGGDEIGNAIAVDIAGNAYIGGGTTSANFPTSFAFQSTNAGGADGTVTGLSAAGNALLFSSYLGGSGNDTVAALSVNCISGLLVVGTTASANLSGTAGTLQSKFGGATDGFIAKIAAGTASTAIADGGVVNGANFSSAPVAPGSLITVFGSNLASGTSSALATPLAATLAGATVSINGTPAPLVYASPGQLNVQLPYEITAGAATATVTAACGASSPVSFQVVPAAPYLLQSADGAAVVQNQDLSVNTASNPAAKGSVVTVYLTGIGPVDNPVATGAAAGGSPVSRATLPFQATIGNSNATVQFLGLTPGFVGLAQANLFVPNLSPGKYPIVVTVGGVSSNPANLWVN